MNDDEFLAAFLGGTLAPDQFHHRDHLRLAWLLARRMDADAAGDAVGAGIRAFAARTGHDALYHETLTRFWMHVVAYAMQVRPDIGDFETFLAAFPHLLDKVLPSHHWRPQTLHSSAARLGWVPPDLRALPG